MRICDRCGEKPISKMLVDQISHEQIDLCFTCGSEFDEWRNVAEQEKRKPGRPKKEV